MTDEQIQEGQLAETIVKLDAAWERRKSRLLRSLRESLMERWMRRRR